jgi:hypothetical protein
MEEFDGTPLAATIVGSRLKRFFSRLELDNHCYEALGTIRVQEALEAEDPSNGNDEKTDGEHDNEEE